MDQDEYRRRQEFCDVIKSLSKSEHIEIARILRKHSVTLSENRSGLFFDMTKVTPVVFEDLLKFHDFVQQNNIELQKREANAKQAKGVVQ